MNDNLEKVEPATVAEIAALNFEPIPEFRDAGKDVHLKRAKELAGQTHLLVAFAALILSMSKDELIRKVAEEYDSWGPLLMTLARGKDDLEAMVELMGKAEIRLAVAVANVEGDDDDPHPSDAVAA